MVCQSWPDRKFSTLLKSLKKPFDKIQFVIFMTSFGTISFWILINYRTQKFFRFILSYIIPLRIICVCFSLVVLEFELSKKSLYYNIIFQETDQNCNIFIKIHLTFWTFLYSRLSLSSKNKTYFTIKLLWPKGV